MRLVRSSPNLVTRDDDGPDILRVDNCSEVDVAGNFYEQDGKYYDKCYEFENEDAPEDDNLGWLVGLISGLLLLYMFFMTYYKKSVVVQILSRPWTPERCYNTCCARCEPQPVVRNDKNASISTISNISTISANIRQPPSRPPSPSAPPLSEIQEDLFDRLPRSKASENQCAGQSKYFF